MASAAQELDAGHYDETLKQLLDAIGSPAGCRGSEKSARRHADANGRYRPSGKSPAKGAQAQSGFLGGAIQSRGNSFPAEELGGGARPVLALGQEPNEQAQGATADLIQFKILLTYLLQVGKRGAILDRLKDVVGQPGFYYARQPWLSGTRIKPRRGVNLRAAEKALHRR
jgi:hypothetical protein